ncbi:uroporphyrinogen decarboxylase family protein [Verrucomicrobiota bacterium]
MQGSIDRVRSVINGDMPDRAPLFDLLRNDAVINHFTGRELTVENGPEVAYKAYEPAMDATRPSVGIPSEEKTIVLEDGREQRCYRWTTWTEQREYADCNAYVSAKRKEIELSDPSVWGEAQQRSLDGELAWIAEERRKLGEVFFVPGISRPGLMGIFGEVGLEAFSYYLADCPDIIVELLESNTVRAVTLAEHHPEDHGIEVGFLGDDIAFNSGPLLSPAWLKEHYFPRLSKVIAAWHAKGTKVLFHSDGNLNPILDDLVEAGIDGLNPIEVLAGMDVADIHCRYPHLFMAGGIDVSQLLPFGSPQQVKDTVKQTIDAAEGRIMIGSSTELGDEVPLKNYLALREAVFENAYA